MIDLVKKEPEVNTECRMKEGEKQSESVTESVDNRATQGAFFVCVCVLALRQHTNQSRVSDKNLKYPLFSTVSRCTQSGM